MPLPRSEWDRLVVPNEADLLALNLVHDALPYEWMMMSPRQLMDDASVMALHFDRRRMAEALRSRVIFTEHPELRPPFWDDMPLEIREAFLWMAGRFEATLLDLASQIEAGTVGLKK